MGFLSGGQKSRVVFCSLTQCHPSVIVLDEPTNHLDIQTADVLIKACQDFKGVRSDLASAAVNALHL